MKTVVLAADLELELVQSTADPFDQVVRLVDEGPQLLQRSIGFALEHDLVREVRMADDPVYRLVNFGGHGMYPFKG